MKSPLYFRVKLETFSEKRVLCINKKATYNKQRTPKATNKENKNKNKKV